MSAAGSHLPLRPARVALLLPRFSRYGGVEQFGYRLAAGLAQRGFSVDFICARQETEAPDGVRVHTVGRVGGTRFLKLLWFLWQSEKMRKQGQYDLSISLGKNVQQDVIRMGGGPLLVYWEKSGQAVEAGWKRLLKKTARWLSPVNWLILQVEKRQFSCGCKVIAVSHLVRQWLLEAHPELRPEQISVVYNQPDLTRFAPPASEQAKQEAVRLLWNRCGENGPSPLRAGGPEPVLIGTASTNFVLKGVAPLIKSLRHLPEHMHLFIAGGRKASRYMRLAEKLGVARRVHFCGKVDDMPSFYKALDIFILPTFYDACSNAVLEALASGCGTVSSRYNGASYFLPPEHVLRNPGDDAEIAEKILRVSEVSCRDSFSWPDDVACGLDAFIKEIEMSLLEKDIPGTAYCKAAQGKPVNERENP